ncbi:hypothetical protein GLAREA_01399 [Glarea lozoyensis ATCC 20868]|uniref:Uncharacterized protein n=1 Tax=Glarea lozoyensis (strain ATCC 20868 / MF5171) TaxID=1116229 RepID=S3CG29_GLAL2|nr:uncharacterized protein GLAREA_01399 [Glarea lozoyensis ATCC 20868]EPE25487.1 hypothetical protein GLAREA_01399 [Glarea lozoyensis ATCC 20868]
MDTKQPLRPPSPSDPEPDTAPPSYTDTITSPSYTTTPTYYSSQIRSQLTTLSSTITSITSQQTLLASAREENILSLLTTQIQLFLSAFANSGPKKGTLILVPAGGLTDENAVPTDYDFKNRDEYDRVVRVRGKDEGEDVWFWRDEEMAGRLARYLNPPESQKPKPKPSRPVPSPSAPEPSASRSFWSRKKSNPPPAPLPSSSSSSSYPPEKESSKEPSSGTGDNVTMNVTAEEVVFRTENDFGIFGTERGWGIVLKLEVVIDGGSSGGGRQMR